MNAEIRQRREIAGDLDSALLRLDVDGLRFVLCVALLRGMSAAELDEVNARLNVSRISDETGEQK